MIEILGQKRIRDYFSQAILSGRIAHSFILSGPEGIGKLEFSLFMAQSLLCKQQSSPCGTCPTCLKIEKRLHSDVKMIETNKKSIGVGEIRNLIDEVSRKPYEGDCKIIILCDGELITTEGQNALLKTLEEPPSGVYIILLVSIADHILPTISSRCQLLRFERVSPAEIQTALCKEGARREEAEIAAKLSEGVLGKARLLLNPVYSQLRKETISTAHRLVIENPLTGFEQWKFFVEHKENYGFLTEVLTSWYRDILVFKAVRNPELLMNRDFYDLILEESQLLSYNKLDRILDTIKDTADKVHQNANFQLAIEMMLLKFQEV